VIVSNHKSTLEGLPAVNESVEKTLGTVINSQIVTELKSLEDIEALQNCGYCESKKNCK